MLEISVMFGVESERLLSNSGNPDRSFGGVLRSDILCEVVILCKKDKFYRKNIFFFEFMYALRGNPL